MPGMSIAFAFVGIQMEPTMKTTVGSKIVGRLREFTEALESGKAISDQFTCRKVVLDLKPSHYSPELVKKT
jgi:hypothetical protein